MKSACLYNPETGEVVASWRGAVVAAVVAKGAPEGLRLRVDGMSPPPGAESGPVGDARSRITPHGIEKMPEPIEVLLADADEGALQAAAAEVVRAECWRQYCALRDSLAADDPDFAAPDAEARLATLRTELKARMEKPMTVDTMIPTVARYLGGR